MRCSIRRAWHSHSSAPQSGRALGLSALTCLGRHTVSGLLCTAGQQFRDWSAAYRLFERERLDPQAQWRVSLNGVLETLPPASPLVALLDDTLIRKRGHRIAGTSWRRAKSPATLGGLVGKESGLAGRILPCIEPM